jgi:glycerophosphoryl diester phosphodiesterase
MKKIDFLTTHNIAHQGLHDEISCENSLSAFSKAIEKGLPIELDVQASLEGTPVVFHDATLERLTALEGPVYHQMLEILETTPLKASANTIPSLKTVLAHVNGHVPLLIEIKSDSPYVSLTKAVIETLKDYKGLYALQSFDPKVVRLIKKINPSIIRGQISGMFEDSTLKRFKKWYLSRMVLNLLSKPDYIVYDVAHLQKPWVQKERRKGRPVLAYTITRQSQVSEALKKADNIIFEGFSIE